MKPRKLEWGETPWDKLPRKELLRDMQRAYAAVEAARSVLRIMVHLSPESPFWDVGGRGYEAIEKGRQVMSRVTRRFDEGSVYESFFRYADDLLFEDLGSGWRVCENGHMFGDSQDEKMSVCLFPKCGAPMRLLKWSDLAPKKAGKDGAK